MVANICKVVPLASFFHCQVLHRTIITNKKLHLFNLRNDDLCDTCQTVDTISHLLYECQNTENVWRELLPWLSQRFNSTIYLDKASSLLGNPKNEPIVNGCVPCEGVLQVLVACYEGFNSLIEGKLLSILFS